uniref:Profilin n=1 Tax=Syphacia muris TaxID=451379 RepID=A0A0N5A7M8_9BILA
MSWNDIIDQYLIKTGAVSKAAICGFDGSIWGKSDNFKLEESEAAAASQCFKSKDFVLGTGVVLEGVKYYVLQADDERVIGRKGSSGFFIYTSNRAVIISVYEDGLLPGTCSKATGALADYFKTINY